MAIQPVTAADLTEIVAMLAADYFGIQHESPAHLRFNRGVRDDRDVILGTGPWMVHVLPDNVTAVQTPARVIRDCWRSRAGSGCLHDP